MQSIHEFVFWRLFPGVCRRTAVRIIIVKWKMIMMNLFLMTKTLKSGIVMKSKSVIIYEVRSQNVESRRKQR